MLEKPKLTNNLVFSFLMSSPGSEEAAKSFINAALEDVGRPLTKSVLILNPFSLTPFLSGKVSVLDVKAQDVDGRYFNVEMQTTNKKGFNNRILYYGSKLYSEQLAEGDDYSLLNPVVSIVVARFAMFPELPGMHNVFTLSSEKNPQIVFSNQLQIHTIELIKEQLPTADKVNSKLYSWIDFFNNGHEKSEVDMSELLEDPGLALAVKKYRELCQDPKLRELALIQEKAERDRRAELSYAQEEGMAQGMANGILVGLKNAIVRRFTRRFPEADVSEVQQTLEPITDEDRLNDILDLVFDCATESEFLAQAKQVQ